VWTALQRVQEEKLTELLGVAPGPANGYTLDVILCLERFGALLDWGMVILNPLEPWPGRLCLDAAVKYDVKLITRVVDHGGLFHDDVKPGHTFGPRDHRTFRPQGWVENGNTKIDAMRAIAERHGLTLLQLACVWNLSHEPVRSVVPTLIQEAGEVARSIESKLDDLAALPDLKLTEAEREEIAQIGNNKGCMALKGGVPEFTGEAQPDRWEISGDLRGVAERWKIQPEADLALLHGGH
jgi:aryl-alcohol dehydrogenase-like predicted oxidoreductase